MVCCKCVEGFNCTKPVNVTAHPLLPKLPSSVEGGNCYPAAQTKDCLAGIYDHTKYCSSITHIPSCV